MGWLGHEETSHSDERSKLRGYSTLSCLVFRGMAVSYRLAKALRGWSMIAAASLNPPKPSRYSKSSVGLPKMIGLHYIFRDRKKIDVAGDGVHLAALIDRRR